MSNVNLEISPANVLSNGVVSYRNGNPVLQFIIGEAEQMLLGSSIRLCGKFVVRADSSGAGSATSYVESGVAPGNQINTPARLGVYACIDQLVLKSQQTHQTIEHIRHYNRFASSFLPVTSSLQDNMGHLAESSLTMPNWALHKQSVLQMPAQRTGNDFCVSLPCGLFNGMKDIPLSGQNGLKGLLVEIHLAPDSNVLFADDGATAISDAFYELSDLKLIAEARPPTPQESSQENNAFEYNSISSYFTSINSTNAVVNFNLGLKRVLGVFGNFIPSSFINNRTQNGMETQHLSNTDNTTALLNQVVFTRAGERFPLEFNVDRVSQVQGDLIYGQIDAQIQRNFLDAVKSFSKNDRIMASQNNTFNQSWQAASAVVNSRDILTLDGGSVYGVGINYDNVSGEGVDFSAVPWGLQMETGLTSDRPHALYLFVHAKQTLTWNSSGLEVVS
jgi:hypothetical protein|tara:strand:+ start:163 stop:1503 length:1341 start_codon:yes stop_codon:yes gene_type:complete